MRAADLLNDGSFCGRLPTMPVNRLPWRVEFSGIHVLVLDADGTTVCALTAQFPHGSDRDFARRLANAQAIVAGVNR